MSSRALMSHAVSAALVAAVFTSAVAHAAIVFDNISGATFATGAYLVGEHAPLAGSEIPRDFRVSTRVTIAGDGEWRLTALGFRVSRNPELLGNASARVWLSEAVEGGGPSMTWELGSISTTSTTATTVVLDSLSAQHVSLLGGHSYWITLGALPDHPDATRLLWHRSSLGTLGQTYADDLNTPDGFLLQEGRTPGIKIGADAIPAPGALALLGLCGCAPKARRRR